METYTVWRLLLRKIIPKERFLPKNGKRKHPTFFKDKEYSIINTKCPWVIPMPPMVRDMVRDRKTDW